MSDDDYDTSEARRILRRSIDYFNYWRCDTLRYWRDSERRPIYSQFPIPYEPRTGPEHAFVHPDADVPERGIHHFRDIARTDEGPGGRTVPASLEGYLGRLGYRMVKILGAGSQGLAVLFEETNTGDKFVFKWSLDIYSIATEMWCMRQMVGARHIIQVQFCFSVQRPILAAAALEIRETHESQRVWGISCVCPSMGRIHQTKDPDSKGPSHNTADIN